MTAARAAARLAKSLLLACAIGGWVAAGPAAASATGTAAAAGGATPASASSTLDADVAELLPRPDEGPELPEAVRGPLLHEAALALAFTTQNSRAALKALQDGDFVRALQLLPGKPKDASLRWLRALALRGAGKQAEARRLFEQLASAGGPLADRATFLAAQAAQKSGAEREAAQLYGRVTISFVDADQALLERARLLSRFEPAGPATASSTEQLLAPLLDGRVKGDAGLAHLLAGDAQKAAGAKEAARAHYRAAWVDRPLSGAAGLARAREKLLGAGPEGAAAPPVATEKLVRRAEILLDAHRNREALVELSRLQLQPLCPLGCPGDQTPAALIRAAVSLFAPGALPADHRLTPQDVGRAPANPADPLACRARLAQGRALRKLRELDKARANLAPVVLRCADPELRGKALFLLAQLESIAHRPEAAALWEALGSHFPTSSLADDALLNQALEAHRAGDLVSERRLLERLVTAHPDADTWSEAMFRLAWSWRAEGKPHKGLPWLDRLAARVDAEGAGEERARYWRARTLLQPEPGAPKEQQAAALSVARADLLWLVRERPLTYHALLARGRLAQLDPKLAARFDAAQAKAVGAALAAAKRLELHQGSLPKDPHYAPAVELLRLGMLPEAARELAAVDRSVLRAAGQAGQEPLLVLADLASRAGELRAAHALIRSDLRELLRRTSRPIAVKAAVLAYPLAFRDEIAKAARGAGVPPDLLQALMREESALDPHALSPVGALGLTQLMPATARGVAKKLQLKGFKTSQLLEPATNILIGGTYLGELYARFGHPAPTLASYNAGPGNVGGWMRARPALPMDEWVEEIPLDETRGYVKRCLRSYAAYQLLYGDGVGRLLTVPQELAQK